MAARKTNWYALPYYFKGIEECSPGQLQTLARLQSQIDRLSRELNPYRPAPEAHPDERTPEQAEQAWHAQVRRILTGFDLSQCVKAAWTVDDVPFAGVWNPDFPRDGMVIFAGSLMPSAKNVYYRSLKGLLTGSEVDPAWGQAAADVFSTVEHASEEQWQALTTKFPSSPVRKYGPTKAQLAKMSKAARPKLNLEALV